MTMTRRERLMNTLQGKPVDRPAVSFYEIGLRKYNPDDPDPFNVHNDPSWRPLIQLAEERTDIIRGVGACISMAPNESSEEFFRTETWQEGQSKFTKTTLTVAGRTMTKSSRRDADTDTTWTTEHLLKDVDDLKAYLEIPDEVSAYELNCPNLEATEEELSDAGIVMINTGDPICAAAELFSMEEYTIIAMTEPELFHKLLAKLARRIHPAVQKAAERYPGRFWRIYGPEYAGEPYLPPRLFEEYVVRYTGPMVEAIQSNGGYARIHSHGKLKNILPHIAKMKPAALEPIEPPPWGDVELIDVRRQYGRDMVLCGNIEIADIVNLEPKDFESKVVQALREGTDGDGRGFILLPTSCPYGREITAKTMKNYQTMIDLAENWG